MDIVAARAYSRSRLSLFVAYVIVFAFFLDTQSLSPLIVPYAKAVGASVALAGIIAGAYSAVNLLGNLGAGYWIDRIGRKTPIVLGLGLTGIVLFLYPLATNPYLLLALRVAHGLGAALAAPACLAYVADLAAVTGRGRAMSMYGAASGLAGLTGPPLAGILRDRMGYPAVFVVLAGLMLLLLPAALVLISESLPTGATSRGSPPWQALHRRRLLLAYVCAFCWMFSLGVLLIFLPLAGQAWPLASTRVGLLFAAFALAAVVVQVSPFGRLSDWWGREQAIALGFAVAAAALAVLSGLQRWEAMMAAMFVYGSGLGLLFPAMSALIADESDVHTRGTASGVFTAVFSLGAVAGMASAGVLVTLQQTTGIHPFQWAGLVILVGMTGALLSWFTRSRRQGQRLL